MKKGNILALADLIASANYEFDMSDPSCHVKPGDRCGSAGCIGGHSVIIWPEVENGVPQEVYFPGQTIHRGFSRERLADRLGLSYDEVSKLCFPDHEDAITRTEAVTMLRRIAGGADIDWAAVSPGWAEAERREQERYDNGE